jgi:1-deoxy-D-xylulose-5-phosphate synthase
VRRIGLPDAFVEHGPIPILRRQSGMDVDGVVAAAREMLAAPVQTTSR